MNQTTLSEANPGPLFDKQNVNQCATTTSVCLYC